MIISSGSAQMSSTRNYQRTVQNTSTTFRWNMDRSRIQTVSFTGSSNFVSRESYTGNSNYHTPTDLFSPSYNRFGRPADDRWSRLQNSALQPNAYMLNRRADLFTTRNVLGRIVNMFRHASMKFNFLDNSTWFNMAGSQPQNNILFLTSVSAPTVWNRLDTQSFFMEEKEAVSYAATGSVVTADGRTIDFNVTMGMSRSMCESAEFAQFSQYEQILTDPLVINLDNNPTAITDKTFLFDLDCNGQMESISQLAGGSGFLALDRNNDGIINDGSELFGPQSGNGFADLAAYDTDGNGWIDEADDIYSKLRVWVKDADGNDKLLTLKEADVGAISTGSSKTDFSLMGSDKELKGKVRSTGMYLKESGGAGTMQQVDFA